MNSLQHVTATSLNLSRRPAVIVIGVLGLAVLVGWHGSPVWLSGVAAILGATLLFTQPVLGLPVLAVIAYQVPLEIFVSESVSVNGVILLLPVLIGAWTLRVMLRHGSGIHWSRTFAPLLALIAAALLSWLAGNANWDPFMPQSRNLLFVQFGQWAIITLSALAYFFAAQQNVESLKWLVVVFVAFGILALVGRYGGPLTAIGRPWINYYAVSNGTFFVWMSALAGGQALFNHELGRGVRSALMLVAVSVPVLGFWQNTDWASSWLPPTLALAILVWLRSRFISLTVLVAGVIVVALFSGLLLAMYDWEFEREVSIGGRFILWSSVLELALRSPWIGLGLTQYHQYFRFIPLLTDRGRWYQPNVNSHNMYIDLFAQLGILGLSVFFWAVAEIVALGWRLSKNLNNDFSAAYVMSALAGFGAMLVGSAIVEWLIPFVYNVGFSGFRFSVFSWIFLGGLVVIERNQTCPSNP